MLRGRMTGKKRRGHRSATASSFVRRLFSRWQGSPGTCRWCYRVPGGRREFARDRLRLRTRRWCRHWCSCHERRAKDRRRSRGLWWRPDLWGWHLLLYRWTGQERHGCRPHGQLCWVLIRRRWQLIAHGEPYAVVAIYQHGVHALGLDRLRGITEGWAKGDPIFGHSVDVRAARTTHIYSDKTNLAICIHGHRDGPEGWWQGYRRGAGEEPGSVWGEADYAGIELPADEEVAACVGDEVVVCEPPFALGKPDVARA